MDGTILWLVQCNLNCRSKLSSYVVVEMSPPSWFHVNENSLICDVRRRVDDYAFTRHMVVLAPAGQLHDGLLITAFIINIDCFVFVYR